VWRYVIAAAILVGLAAVSIGWSRYQLRRRYDRAMRLWLSASPGDRVEAMTPLLQRPETDGAAWFLHGCTLLQAYRTKEAARAFGMSHHADCEIETAALLSFACLKSADGEDPRIVEQIIATWHQMKRPEMTRRRADRLLLDCLASVSPVPPGMSPLGRLAWLVLGPSLRGRIEQALEDTGRWPELKLQAAASVEAVGDTRRTT